MLYDLIYADPPWQQTKGGIRACRPKQAKALDYPTLTLNEIKEHIARFMHSDTVLFLWTIDKFLHEAEELAYSLQYKLHARLIWNKLNGVAPAFTVRFSHEYLLWLYRGKFKPIDALQKGRWATVFQERATVHSRKPKSVRMFLECIYPKATRIELYARERFVGWDAWGNEV